jgi:sulfite reductase alpha subunit-like flavoprotein
MKQPPKAAKPATTASGPRVGLPAKDLAQVRAIAATANQRATSKRKALLLLGTSATAAAEAMAKELRRDLSRRPLRCGEQVHRRERKES